ncbi:MFS transporter [Vibrio marisflavi]|uniref:Proline/betaine transporter n=1 Tax=Vibrio marisflavi CECT 7928 TaxID=634439 RepID=A0ABN8E2J3_9VIBR|nr:MFS transporter [Vibrio marisflavi]CAH0539217.1 Proline/betaine transporter [Vibrio marisflavi CECT 7928]
MIDKEKKKIVWTGFVGTCLEWFDFAIFGVMSAILATNFFPDDSGPVSLIKTFAVFASGFLIRPIATFIWGYLGDKHGRKNTVVFTVLLMSIASLGLGLLPNFESIGIASTVLLVAFRMIQGFACSGEHCGMVTYLYELLPGKTQSRASSIAVSGVYIGMAMATLIGLILHAGLSKQELYAWGWRVPFILSGFAGLASFYIRKKMVETAEFLNATDKQRLTVKEWFKLVFNNKYRMLLGIGAYQLAVLIPYIAFVFVVSYVEKNQLIPVDQLYASNLINLILCGVFVFLAAKVCDALPKQRENIQIVAALALLVGTPFLFESLKQGNIVHFFFAQLYFGFTVAFLVGPFMTTAAKLFDVKVRYTGVSVIMNISAAVFGGMSPVILSLFDTTKSPELYSVMFIMASAAISLVCISANKKVLLKNV